MSAKIHPGIIAASVLSFALAAVFTAGLVTKSNEAKRYLEGDPERPSGDTVPKLQKAREDLNHEIETLQHDAAIRQRELDHADLELHMHTVYFNGPDLLGGISTPGKETDTVGLVKDTKLKEHRLALTRLEIEKSGERLEALKTEYSSAARQSGTRSKARCSVTPIPAEAAQSPAMAGRSSTPSAVSAPKTTPAKPAARAAAISLCITSNSAGK